MIGYREAKVAVKPISCPPARQRPQSRKFALPERAGRVPRRHLASIRKCGHHFTTFENSGLKSFTKRCIPDDRKLGNLRRLCWHRLLISGRKAI